MRLYALGLAVLLMVSSVLAEGVDPLKPAAIQTQEVPVVPTELMARLSQYQNTRSATFRGFAPDGNGILIATRFGNAMQLHQVAQPGSTREQLTFFDEPAAGRFIPHASDGALLLSVDRGGNENAQLWLLSRQQFRTDRISDGKSRNMVGAWRDDGSELIVTSNRRNGKDMDLYRVNPRATNPTRQRGESPHSADSWQLLLEVNGQTWQTDDWSLDGKRIALHRYVSANESYPALLDVETKQLTDLPLPTDGKAAVDQMAFSPDGQAVYVTTDAGSEFLRLGRFDLSSKKWSWLSDGLNWDVDEFKVDPKTGLVAFLLNEHGLSRLFVVNPATEPRREIALPSCVATGLEFAPDGTALGLTIARPDAPAEAYSIRLADGELIRWTFSEVGGLDPRSFVAPTRIEFASFDSHLIPSFVFKPRSTLTRSASEGERLAANRDQKKMPVLISIHGGPESQYRPIFSAATQFFANELGITVLHPNVRGSAGYGKTYLQLDNAEKREDSVKDIGGLLDWIAKQPDLDASRVAVIGGSYGGYMVLATLTHFGDRIKAGIDNVGICNFITFLEKTAAYRVDLRRAEYGDERQPAMRSVFERISPLNNTDKIRSALLVIHGRNDPRVPFFEAEQIASKVRASGRSVWTVFADNEGHGFQKKENADFQRAIEVLFLKQHLGLSP